MKIGERTQAAVAVVAVFVILFVPLVPVTVHLGAANFSFPYTEYRSLGCAALGLGVAYAPGFLSYGFCTPFLP